MDTLIDDSDLEEPVRLKGVRNPDDVVALHFISVTMSILTSEIDSSILG